MKLLIVDDSKVFRDRLRRHLAQAPELVIAAEVDNGLGALAAIATLDPDAILLDLELPSSNGFEVLRYLKATGRKVPVIVMTNHASDRIGERCLALGAYFVMDKLEVSSRLLPVLAGLTHGRDR